MRMAKIVVIVTLMLTIAGCDTDDEKAARIARQSAARQAEQNQEMSKLNREVAAGTRRLVEADSQTRQEIIAAQKDLARQQADIAKQHDHLEAERRSFAQRRYRESLLAPVLSGLGHLLLCALPLVLAWYLLHGWQREAADEIAIGNLLVEELVSERPVLLPHPILPPAIERNRSSDLLPGPGSAARAIQRTWPEETDRW